MKLKDLIIDIDYQKHYTYDKRVDLFNKYNISTSLDFFVPIWALAQFICNQYGINSITVPDNNYTHFGHGQRVLLNTIPTEVVDKKYPRIRTWKENGNLISIYYYFPNIEKCRIYDKQREVIQFNDKSKEIQINNYGFSNRCKIKRDFNIYDKIDEWLLDFGFEKW